MSSIHLLPVPSPQTDVCLLVKLPTASFLREIGEAFVPPSYSASSLWSCSLSLYSKQGSANCMALSFYGTKTEKTNKLENFTPQSVKHSHSATGDKCCQVPSAVIQAHTQGSLLM